MKKLLLVLGLGVILTSCKKEALDSREGDLFKVEQFNKSYFTGSAHRFKPTKEWSVIGGDVLLVDDNHILVGIKKSHSVQLSLDKVSYCGGGVMKYFKVTEVDSDFNELSDGKKLLVRCESNTISFTNE